MTDLAPNELDITEETTLKEIVDFSWPEDPAATNVHLYSCKGKEIKGKKIEKAEDKTDDKEYMQAFAVVLTGREASIAATHVLRFISSLHEHAHSPQSPKVH